MKKPYTPPIDPNKANFMDHVRTFSGLIQSKSLFFELIDELRFETCECGKNCGMDILIKIMKMFGGLNIRVPSYQELVVYMYMLEHSEEVIRHAMWTPRMASTKVMELLKSKGITVTPEVNLRELIDNLLKVVTGECLNDAMRRIEKEQGIWTSRNSTSRRKKKPQKQ